jgi:chemotaxis protein MotB
VAQGKGPGAEEKQPIIIKKVKKGGHSHHGGSWKVAYADFVTAMMAFFLLLWLLNVSNDDQRRIISSHFDPTHPRVSKAPSGAGGVMGGVSISKQGSMTTNLQEIRNMQQIFTPVQQPRQGTTGGEDDKKMRDASIRKLEEALKAREDERFEKAKEDLRKMIEENEELAELSENLVIDITPEGLRIQIVDREGRPMFPLGSAQMYDYTKKLMQEIAIVINEMPNDLSIRGHTDSYQYAEGATYTNWELSADRANSSRRVLLSSDVEETRVANVMGKSDQEPFVEDNPFDAQNRRISIIALRETLDEALKRGEFSEADVKNIISGEKPKEIKKSVPLNFDDLPREGEKPLGTFQRTPGEVYFP